jgi:DNA polymerase bacteriophage-type
MIRKGSIGSTAIAGKTLRSSASYERLPPLPPAERALWELSSRINSRGFRVDRSFAEAARKIAQAAAPEINQELTEITGGAVSGINQIARLTVWLQAQGCAVERLDKRAIEKLLATELPAQVQRVLELRLGGARRRR